MPVDVVPDADIFYRPDVAGLDEVGRLGEVWGGAVLRATENQAPGALHGLNDFAAFDDGVSQRLLDIDIFAGLGCEDRDGGVPMVRGADDDGVDIFAVEQLAEVLHA